MIPKKGNAWLLPDYPLVIDMRPAKTLGRVILTIETPIDLADHLQRALDLLVAMGQNLQTRRTQTEMELYAEEVQREQAALRERLTDRYYEYRVTGLGHRQTMKALATSYDVNPAGWVTAIIRHYVPTATEAVAGLRRLQIRRANQNTALRSSEKAIVSPRAILTTKEG